VIQFLAWTRDFFFSTNSQSSSGAQSPSQWSTRNAFPRIKQPRNTAYHLPHLMPRPWMSGLIPPPSHIFMTCIRATLPCWPKTLDENEKVRNSRSKHSSVSFGFYWSNNMDYFHFWFFQNTGLFKKICNSEMKKTCGYDRPYFYTLATERHKITRIRTEYVWLLLWRLESLSPTFFYSSSCFLSLISITVYTTS
jgi:hypothetical protein